MVGKELTLVNLISDESLVETGEVRGMPATNLMKEAIARKQNLAGVENENKTGRTWQVPGNVFITV